jgi:Transglycosylase SLT domain
MRVLIAGSAAVLVVAAIISATSGGGLPRLPLPGIGRPARGGDPFAYSSSRSGDFTARAIAGNGHVLFTQSPGGVLATAARVARFRGLIDSAVAGSGIDPNLLEGMVFVESAGRPDVIAGNDLADAAGVTQILAETGQSLLGMHIDLAQSRRLTAEMVVADARGQGPRVLRLVRRRAQVDDRFDPRKALAATVRYLRLAERRFGRADLAVVSYHMGIGNLQQVLERYDGGKAVPYVQLYFDTAPDRHASTFDLLSSFGDQSSLYYWRVMGAVQIMHLWRVDRPALVRLASLQTASDTNALVLHPPDRTGSYADPAALYRAYSDRTLVRLPSNAQQLGLQYDRSIGALARRAGGVPALYRGLRAPALDLLVELADRVRSLCRCAPLQVAAAVTDRRYADVVGDGDLAPTTGYTFQIARRYVSRAQPLAFQATLDRLQALNLIAWLRTPQVIEITVASDASQVIVDGP